MQMMWMLVSNGLEVDADVIEADVVWRLLFIVLGRWQGFDLTKNLLKFWLIFKSSFKTLRAAGEKCS